MTQANKNKQGIKSVILTNTLMLVAKQGYHALTIGQILGSCSINKQRFYYYFSSKLEVAISALNYHQADAVCLLERRCATVKWQWIDLVDIVVDFIQMPYARAIALTLIEDSELSSLAKQHFQQWRKNIQKCALLKNIHLEQAAIDSLMVTLCGYILAPEGVVSNDMLKVMCRKFCCDLL